MPEIESENLKEGVDSRPRGWRYKWVGRGAFFLGGVIVAGGVSALYINHEFTGSHTVGAVAGVLVCPPGEPVVGAWLEPSDHADRGWAAWQPVAGHPNIATFTAGLPHSDSISYDLGWDVVVAPRIGHTMIPLY